MRTSSPRLDPSVTEDVDMARINRIVVGMPAFTDPNNPMAQSGSVNLELGRHPVQHSEDYAQRDTEQVGQQTDGPRNGMSAGAESIQQNPFAGFPDDRNDWTKEQWVSAANFYGVDAGGSKQDIRQRVEEAEANQGQQSEQDTGESEQSSGFQTSY